MSRHKKTDGQTVEQTDEHSSTSASTSYTGRRLVLALVLVLSLVLLLELILRLELLCCALPRGLRIGHMQPRITRVNLLGATHTQPE